MCAQYMIKTKYGAVHESFSEPLENAFGSEDWNLRVAPFKNAPVIVSQQGHLVVKSMRYHLNPHWAKEERVKWATYNARLDSISEKASFREAFKKTHCLVPMTSFIEAVYEGEYAGNMIQFHQTNGTCFFAAGIYDNWIKPETREILQSFAIITTTPDEQILRAGHDRQPVFLLPKNAAEWLESKSTEPRALTNYLESNRAHLEFKVEIDRPLKSGWESRK